MMNEISAVKQDTALRHSVALEDRRNLTVTGVLAVVSYDAFTAALETPRGTLTIGGENLNVSELSVSTGEVRISGSIEYLQYTDKKEMRESFFKRLVR